MNAQIPELKWTVMVYMAADTGESFYLKAMEDIREMAAAEFKPDEIRVVVYAVAPPPWAAKCWEVTEGGGIKELAVLPDLTKVNAGLKKADPVLMGGGNPPLSVVQFVNEFAPQFEAQHYLVVLWGHGEGIDWSEKLLKTPDPEVKRFAQGSQSAMHLGELGKVISNVEFRLGVDADKIVLGFDSCLMSMIEVHYELKKSMGWAIAANDEIPDTGWPYTNILNLLKGEDSPDVVAAKIAEECAKWYSTKINKSSVSFSACNLKNIGAVADAVKEVTTELESCLADPTSNLQWIREARDFAEDYGETAYVDLNAFYTKLREISESRLKKATDDKEKVSLNKLIKATRRVCELLSQFVMKSSFSDEYPQKYMNDSLAVSICFPDSQDLKGSLEGLQINWNSYERLSFSEVTGWAKFVRGFLA